MNISHAKAHQLIHSTSFYTLEKADHTALEQHFQSCVQCAEYADRLPQLERLLTRSLQKRWAKPIPAGESYWQDLVDIERRTRRKQKLQSYFGIIRGLAWAGLGLTIILLINWSMGSLRAQEATPLTNGLPTPSPTPEAAEVPIIVVAPLSTQSSNNNHVSEQAHAEVSGFTPTPNPTKLVGLESVLEKTDLNCDGIEERISGISGSFIPYFNPDQWQAIKLETLSDHGPELVWEQSAEEAGVGYLFYELFTLDNCHQFLVLIGHKGKERIRVLRWDGQQMNTVLERPGTFFFPSDNLSPDDFGIEAVPPQTFITFEYNHILTDSKIIWTLLGYEWDGDHFIQTIEKRKSSQGGG